MMNVAVYVRLSDEDKDKRHETDESESIQNQKAMLSDYCRERNWDIFDIYCDEDYSGADRNRPAFNRMLSDCESGLVDIVLCKSQSRFSRDMEVIERYIHNRFLAWKVRFISVVDRADSFDVSNKKARQINGLINEWVLEDASENIRKTLQSKKKRGEFTGSFAPYGYIRNLDDKHKFIIDTNTAPVVRDIFNWYLQGWGYRKIVMKLNALCIPNPTLYKQQQNSRYENPNAERSPSKGLWTQSSVYKIIHNEVYSGVLVQGKSRNISYKNNKKESIPEKDWIRVPDCHEPIIDETVWLRIQEKIKSKTRASKSTQEINAFSGKIKCTLCGASMKRLTYYNKKRTVQYHKYVCGTKINGAMNCRNTAALNGFQFETAVLEQLNKLLSEFYKINEIKIKNKYEIMLEQFNSEIDIIKKQINKINTRKINLYEDKLDGLITKNDFLFYNQKYEKELTGLNIKLKNIEMQTQDTSKKNADNDYINQIIADFTHIKKITRIITDEFIEMIYIGEKAEGKDREIIIHWKL